MGATSPDPKSPDHLTPVVFHTLLVLAGGPHHGYAISQSVEQLTDGRIRMGPGTLYGTLKRLREAGWLEPTADVKAKGSHAARRRYYQLTAVGRRVLEQEARRLSRAVELAQSHAVLQGR